MYNKIQKLFNQASLAELHHKYVARYSRPLINSDLQNTATVQYYNIQIFLENVKNFFNSEKEIKIAGSDLLESLKRLKSSYEQSRKKLEMKETELESNGFINLSSTFEHYIVKLATILQEEGSPEFSIPTLRYRYAKEDNIEVLLTKRIYALEPNKKLLSVPLRLPDNFIICAD